MFAGVGAGLDGTTMDGASGASAPDSDDANNEEILLARVRSGDAAAFELLYVEHVESARRLGAILAGPEGAEDLVSESFARILDALRSGAGPTTSFSAYLHTTIRNRYRDTLRSTRERPASDQPWVLDGEAPPAEELVAGIDANGAVAALASLPGTWQQVLWHLEVEGRKPAEIAGLLTMSPAAVSSLAYRAREGLRRAYLDQHVATAPVSTGCRWTRDRLSQYVRGDLSRRASAKVADHVSGCAACASTAQEIQDLNRKLAAYLFPVVLVGGMKALDTAAGSGAAAGSLEGALKARAEGAPATTVGAKAASGFALAGVTGPAIAAVTVGLVAAVATAWAVAAGNDSDPDSSGHDAIVDVVRQTPTGTLDPSATPPTTGAPTSSPDEDPTPPPPEVIATAPTSRPTTPDPTPIDPDPSTPEDDPTAPSAPDPGGPAGPGGPGDPGELDPDPLPIVVVPSAPTATPITGCDSYGALVMPRTRGVRYTLTIGDAREGPWQVDAYAQNGYRIIKGAQTRFSGDLGAFFACASQVRPEAPTAVPIADCDTYGSLTLPTTTGVRYALTAGDGKQGPWQVTATAEDGYAIADGAQTRFSGDLGAYFVCPQPPSIGSVTKVSGADSATDPWDITVTPMVTDPAPTTLQVTYVFNTGVLITSRSGAGWTCREPGGGEVGAGQEFHFPDPNTPFTCTYDYTGSPPPPVTLTVYGTDANLQNVEPTGSVRLSRDGVVTDQGTF